MADIKTRDVVKGTIKKIDKAAIAADRMRSAYVQTKEKAEHTTHPDEHNAEEYASDRVEGGVDRITHEAAHQFDIYHLLQPDRRIDEGIYNDEIDQYFSYREWKKKHQPLSGVTVREILATEDLNEGALLRIFDGVTAAFYKSDEYNSREYRYSNLSELRKAMKHKEGGTNGKAQ